MLSTRSKMAIARVLNRAIVGSRRMAGRGPLVEAARKGINWKLDLNEGIDLALYLNLYQTVPPRVVDGWIRGANLIVDIGANIGAISLLMAKQAGQATRVVSVEPTDYAYSKLRTNISLNADLRDRVIPIQAAIGEAPAGGGEAKAAAFYSRWPLREGGAEKRHELHEGQFEAAKAARFVGLDALLADLRARGSVSGPVSFIKLDVDGYELGVLESAALTLAEHPPILIEIAPHQQDEVPGRFEQVLAILAANGYTLEHADSGKPLPMSADGLRSLIPHGAGFDALARVP